VHGVWRSLLDSSALAVMAPARFFQLPNGQAECFYPYRCIASVSGTSMTGNALVFPRPLPRGPA
jgi:hypothetical protein